MNNKDDFQTRLNKETKRINDEYETDKKLEQSGIYSKLVPAIDLQELQDGRFARYIYNTHKFVLCLVSNDKNDYIVDDVVYNKCKLYIPPYDIIEGEYVKFPSGLYNYDRQQYKDFIEQFGETMIEPLYCFAYIFAPNKEQFDFLYNELIDHIKENKVPGVLEEDYYMVNIDELDNWYINEFYNHWQDRYKSIF